MSPSNQDPADLDKSQDLDLVATCALGLEELLAEELRQLAQRAPALRQIEIGRGAVTFRGGWPEVWLTNLWLRTANRVQVRLGTWNGHDGDALEAGARNLVRRRHRRWGGLHAGDLFPPSATLAIHATSTASEVRDTRWVALKVKDGLVDGQRDRFGQRSSIDRQNPQRPLRVWLHKNQATLLLDTSGEPLDRRGYRLDRGEAPVRETLAAACVLASGWRGEGPVADPMCGSGTLLAEAGLIALQRPPGGFRSQWPFARLKGFDEARFEAMKTSPTAPSEKAPLSEEAREDSPLRLHGGDLDGEVLQAAAANLTRAGLDELAYLKRRDAFNSDPPAAEGGGLVLINPPYGERLGASADLWSRLGDLLKTRYAGWRAVLLAGDQRLGKGLGLRPSRRLPVRNGPLDARILVLDLYRGSKKRSSPKPEGETAGDAPGKTAG
ncbi:MAG: RNA methyltransferase [Acidobacteriota bacterium]